MYFTRTSNEKNNLQIVEITNVLGTSETCTTPITCTVCFAFAKACNVNFNGNQVCSLLK